MCCAWWGFLDMRNPETGCLGVWGVLQANLAGEKLEHFLVAEPLAQLVDDFLFLLKSAGGHASGVERDFHGFEAGAVPDVRNEAGPRFADRVTQSLDGGVVQQMRLD